MTAAASGGERAARLSSRAAELESQAAALAAEAARLRQVEDKVNIGNTGELVIGALLDQLPGPAWRVLHDRRKQPRSPANLDHIVIGPPGVFVIDAKNWSGGRLRLDERGMAIGRWRRDDELHAAKVDADIVRSVVQTALPACPPCVAVLAFVQDMGLAQPLVHRDVFLVQREHLLGWLGSLPSTLEPAEVQAVARRLEAALPPRTARKGRLPRQAGRGFAPRGSAMEAAQAPSWAPAAPNRAQERARLKREKRRAKLKAELRADLIRLAILVAVLVSLPVTLPWTVEHVLEPLSERISQSVAESVRDASERQAPAAEPASP